MTITSEDIRQLAEMVADIHDATSPHPVAGFHEMYYFVPVKPENADIIADILNKYNIPAQKYMSSLYADTPIIRIPKAAEILPTLNIIIAKVRTAQAHQIQTTFSKSDYDKLIKMMSHTCRARAINKRGQEEMYIYYLPNGKEYTDKALAIFQKYNLPAEPHMSSLNNRMFPIIRVPLIPQTNTVFLKLEIVREARAKRAALTRGRANVTQKVLGNIWDKMRRVFGGDNEK